MKKGSTSAPVPVEKEETDPQSVRHLQSIKYRIGTGYYDSESMRIAIAEAIIDHPNWFEKPVAGVAQPESNR